MRLVIDTDLFISALLADGSLPARLIALWEERRFDLLTTSDQIAELARVTRYPKLRDRLTPAEAGRLVNRLRDVAVLVQPLPTVTRCPDPHDDYLLALAQAGVPTSSSRATSETCWRSEAMKARASSPSATS